jgi:DinB family protein
MVEPAGWRSRVWTFDLPIELFSQILERLRGTPARADDLVRSVPAAILSLRRDGAWSVQEHLGHLADLNALDETRVAEFRRLADVLSAADMTNRATEDAHHNQAAIADILARLRTDRLALVRRLEALPPDIVRHRALHPRLKQPMSVVDWMYFVAEHDDHHLAHARYTAARLEHAAQTRAT